MLLTCIIKLRQVNVSTCITLSTIAHRFTPISYWVQSINNNLNQNIYMITVRRNIHNITVDRIFTSNFRKKVLQLYKMDCSII